MQRDKNNPPGINQGKLSLPPPSQRGVGLGTSPLLARRRALGRDSANSLLNRPLVGAPPRPFQGERQTEYAVPQSSGQYGLPGSPMSGVRDPYHSNGGPYVGPMVGPSGPRAVSGQYTTSCGPYSGPMPSAGPYSGPMPRARPSAGSMPIHGSDRDIRVGVRGPFSITNRSPSQLPTMPSPVSDKGVRVGVRGPLAITNRSPTQLRHMPSPPGSDKGVRVGVRGPLTITNRSPRQLRTMPSPGSDQDVRVGVRGPLILTNRSPRQVQLSQRSPDHVSVRKPTHEPTAAEVDYSQSEKENLKAKQKFLDVLYSLSSKPTVLSDAKQIKSAPRASATDFGAASDPASETCSIPAYSSQEVSGRSDLGALNRALEKRGNFAEEETPMSPSANAYDPNGTKPHVYGNPASHRATTYTQPRPGLMRRQKSSMLMAGNDDAKTPASAQPSYPRPISASKPISMQQSYPRPMTSQEHRPKAAQTNPSMGINQCYAAMNAWDSTPSPGQTEYTEEPETTMPVWDPLAYTAQLYCDPVPSANTPRKEELALQLDSPPAKKKSKKGKKKKEKHKIIAPPMAALKEPEFTSKMSFKNRLILSPVQDNAGIGPLGHIKLEPSFTPLPSKTGGTAVLPSIKRAVEYLPNRQANNVDRKKVSQSVSGSSTLGPINVPEERNVLLEGIRHNHTNILFPIKTPQEVDEPIPDTLSPARATQLADYMIADVDKDLSISSDDSYPKLGVYDDLNLQLSNTTAGNGAPWHLTESDRPMVVRAGNVVATKASNTESLMSHTTQKETIDIKQGADTLTDVVVVDDKAAPPCTEGSNTIAKPSASCITNNMISDVKDTATNGLNQASADVFGKDVVCEIPYTQGHIIDTATEKEATVADIDKEQEQEPAEENSNSWDDVDKESDIQPDEEGYNSWDDIDDVSEIQPTVKDNATVPGKEPAGEVKDKVAERKHVDKGIHTVPDVTPASHGKNKVSKREPTIESIARVSKKEPSDKDMGKVSDKGPTNEDSKRWDDIHQVSDATDSWGSSPITSITNLVGEVPEKEPTKDNKNGDNNSWDSDSIAVDNKDAGANSWDEDSIAEIDDMLEDIQGKSQNVSEAPDIWGSSPVTPMLSVVSKRNLACVKLQQQKTPPVAAPTHRSSVQPSDKGIGKGSTQEPTEHGKGTSPVRVPLDTDIGEMKEAIKATDGDSNSRDVINEVSKAPDSCVSSPITSVTNIVCVKGQQHKPIQNSQADADLSRDPAASQQRCEKRQDDCNKPEPISQVDAEMSEPRNPAASRQRRAKRRVKRQDERNKHVDILQADADQLEPRNPAASPHRCEKRQDDYNKPEPISQVDAEMSEPRKPAASRQRCEKRQDQNNKPDHISQADADLSEPRNPAASRQRRTKRREKRQDDYNKPEPISQVDAEMSEPRNPAASRQRCEKHQDDNNKPDHISQADADLSEPCNPTASRQSRTKRRVKCQDERNKPVHILQADTDQSEPRNRAASPHRCEKCQDQNNKPDHISQADADLSEPRNPAESRQRRAKRRAKRPDDRNKPVQNTQADANFELPEPRNPTASHKRRAKRPDDRNKPVQNTQADANFELPEPRNPTASHQRRAKRPDDRNKPVQNTQADANFELPEPRNPTASHQRRAKRPDDRNKPVQNTQADANFELSESCNPAATRQLREKCRDTGIEQNNRAPSLGKTTEFECQCHLKGSPKKQKNVSSSETGHIRRSRGRLSRAWKSVRDAVCCGGNAVDVTETRTRVYPNPDTNTVASHQPSPFLLIREHKGILPRELRKSRTQLTSDVPCSTSYIVRVPENKARHYAVAYPDHCTAACVTRDTQTHSVQDKEAQTPSKNKGLLARFTHFVTKKISSQS